MEEENIYMPDWYDYFYKKLNEEYQKWYKEWYKKRDEEYIKWIENSNILF